MRYYTKGNNLQTLLYQRLYSMFLHILLAAECRV